MRLIFAGTPLFAARALAALLAAGHHIGLVLAQPDRPSGRGMKLLPGAVKALAIKNRLDVYQPATLQTLESWQRLHAVQAEAVIVAAYGLILPESVLGIARLGAINIHASLLPRWRGAAPIQRAILAGDRQSGISIMQMDAGLDTGPVLSAEPIPITDDDTAGSLHDKLAELGARMIAETLSALAHGPIAPAAQPEDGATYAAKISKAEAEIDWTDSAAAIGRKVRAFNPHPGASSSTRGVALKVWRAGPVGQSGPPGKILGAGSDGIIVACGSGALCLQELQRAGGKRLPAAEFLAGFPLAAGERLESLSKALP